MEKQVFHWRRFWLKKDVALSNLQTILNFTSVLAISLTSQAQTRESYGRTWVVEGSTVVASQYEEDWCTECPELEKCQPTVKTQQLWVWKNLMACSHFWRPLILLCLAYIVCDVHRPQHSGPAMYYSGVIWIIYFKSQIYYSTPLSVTLIGRLMTIGII